VVRTSNKKYFKKIDIFDMTRFNIILQKDQLKWTYQNNTLIITVIRMNYKLVSETWCYIKMGKRYEVGVWKVE
jgi:hypothetical protein